MSNKSKINSDSQSKVHSETEELIEEILCKQEDTAQENKFLQSESVAELFQISSAKTSENKLEESQIPINLPF